MKRFFLFGITFAFALAFTFNGYSQNSGLYFADPDRSWVRSGVNITENIFSVRDKGAYSEVNSYLSFQASDPGRFNSDTQIEMVSYFQIPESYSISNLWLWVGEDIMEARIYDKWTAGRIYEGIVNRRKDPAILFKRSPRDYELRIYPFKPDEIRKIRITYLVPNEIDGQSKTIPLISPLKSKANSAISETGVLLWGDDQASNLSITAHEEAVFIDDSLSGDRYIKTTFTDNSSGGNLELKKRKNFNGVEINTYSGETENFYELTVLPSALLENDKEQSVVFLINYSSTYSTISLDNILDEIKSHVNEKLDENDKFNLYISGLNISKLSDTWVPADSASIEDAFSNFASNGSQVLNLNRLFVEGIDLLKLSETEDGVIHLISSSQEYTNFSEANEFLDAIKSYGQGIELNVNVADVQNRSVSYSYRNGIQYRGNEYLYSTLTRETGGELTNYSYSSNPFNILSKSFGYLTGLISNFEVYVEPSGGISFSNYKNAENTDISVGGQFTQLGKFVGGFPFEVKFTGIFQDSVFIKEYVIQENETQATDSTLKRVWTSKRITQLESGNPTNSEIETILDLSIKNRILSKYSAFLALEPSDTVFACASCVDESSLVSIDETIPSSFKIDSLSAYPNPFNPTTNIQVELSNPWNASNSSIKIYNVVGQEVSDVNTSSFNGQKAFKVQWDARQSGNLSTGVYFVRVATPDFIKSLKITYLK